MSTLEERALADADDSDRFEFAGTQRDTLTSFVKTSGALTAMTAERDAALSTLADFQTATQKALRDASHEITLLTVAVFERDTTIARVTALLGHHDGPLRAVRGVREADIRIALDPTNPKGTKP